MCAGISQQFGRQVASECTAYAEGGACSWFTAQTLSEHLQVLPADSVKLRAVALRG